MEEGIVKELIHSGTTHVVTQRIEAELGVER